ncbi:MAG: hypothetical protein ABJA76_17945, partial [Mucilaginibacter sp.]
SKKPPLLLLSYGGSYMRSKGALSAIKVCSDSGKGGAVSMLKYFAIFDQRSFHLNGSPLVMLKA